MQNIAGGFSAHTILDSELVECYELSLVSSTFETHKVHGSVTPHNIKIFINKNVEPQISGKILFINLCVLC